MSDQLPALCLSHADPSFFNTHHGHAQLAESAAQLKDRADTYGGSTSREERAPVALSSDWSSQYRMANRDVWWVVDCGKRFQLILRLPICCHRRYLFLSSPTIPLVPLQPPGPDSSMLTKTA
ncbi:unnamed protein product [Rhizoctonia solani]|uniref:Uncharacterized protein n=1 Tax=Rhizoctonia solani TaxID=456999 RepID=A0A8H3CUI8_9AGAM|nr:unnamed protein product [Rhizoctonia solani]